MSTQARGDLTPIETQRRPRGNPARECPGYTVTRLTKGCIRAPGTEINLLAREREIEGRPAVDRRFGPYFAPVAMDDALDRRKSDASAGELRFRVQALERTEELGGVAGIEAGAVVANEVDRAAGAVDARAEFDLAARLAAGEFPCV
jgi:hypothetical protein